MRCVPLCLSVVCMSVTARVKGQRQTFALPLTAGMRRQPFPPLPGFPLSPPPSLSDPAQPPPATLRSAVCFNTHGLFINALSEVSFHSDCQAKATFLESALFFLSR